MQNDGTKVKFQHACSALPVSTFPDHSGLCSDKRLHMVGQDRERCGMGEGQSMAELLKRDWC
jgi:hypothetical protein